MGVVYDLAWSAGRVFLRAIHICALLCAVVALVFLAGPSMLGLRNQSTAILQRGSGQNIGFVVPEHAYDCIDGSQANTILFYGDFGTISYNWVTGQNRTLNSRPIELCTSTGLLFAKESTSSDGSYQASDPRAWRFSSADPDGRAVDHMPTNTPDDGSLQMYALDMPYGSQLEQKRLWASADGGVTWEERGVQFYGRIVSVAALDTDGRSIYIAVNDGLKPQDGTLHFLIYFSADAGLTWEKRSTFTVTPEAIGYNRLYLQAIPGNATPIDQFILHTSISYIGSSQWRSANYITNDGARTFQLIDKGGMDNNYNPLGIYHTNEGLLRQYASCPSMPDGKCSLSLSIDGGQTWQPLPLPDITYWNQFTVSEVAPWNVLFAGDDKRGGGVYVSHDGGHNWQRYETMDVVLATTPYLPLAVIGEQDQHVHVQTLTNAGQSLTSRVNTTNPSDPNKNSYFELSGHNLAPIFRAYWQTHGGLPQQGLPITEAFREVSELDGKVYTVEYFERAKFEYHPENDKSRQVLLSLLGVTEYKKRHGLVEASGQRANSDNPLFFSQTGHTIGGLFRKYWEANGGLEQQGYPISDEFEEQNPLDGKLYIVQYFERAVFESHPENAGTPYEVLLSQLGRFETETKYGRTH